ncbi:MAG: hypothetical protein GTN76_13925 [Candidatus Aenigmarchaeota archaeon]|nr:hypothetical protein [Candidatus Aenigmarchaeota archaeon]
MEDDSWLGTGVIVMPNMKIGQGALVEAGSLVKKCRPITPVAWSQPNFYKK